MIRGSIVPRMRMNAHELAAFSWIALTSWWSIRAPALGSHGDGDAHPNTAS